jgi:hypothetical protein
MGGRPEEDDEAGQEASDKVYFTRLHVRYNRKAFPQDLLFQETANMENFQARYIITHPATGDLNCPEGKKYLSELKERRKDELEMLTYLTGKGPNDWDLLAQTDEERSVPGEGSYTAAAVALQQDKKGGHGIWVTSLGMIVLISLACFRRKGRTG